tara:strand:- start:73 stop:564 length:492 start_codon:yes stop_codon:yes gene_type:complete
MKQGTKANKNGISLENLVEDCVVEYLCVPSERYSQTDLREDILLKGVPYTNIYGSNRCRSEFVLCLEGREIRIECKAQHSAGSVDEKLPYLYMNFTQTIEEDEAIIVIEGDGFKKGAKEWLHAMCKGTKVRVMSFAKFRSECKKGLPKAKKPSFFSRFFSIAD